MRTGQRRLGALTAAVTAALILLAGGCTDRVGTGYSRLRQVTWPEIDKHGDYIKSLREVLPLLYLHGLSSGTCGPLPATRPARSWNGARPQVVI